MREHVRLGGITGACICIGTLFIRRHLMRHNALHDGWVSDTRSLRLPEGGNGLLVAQSDLALPQRQVLGSRLTLFGVRVVVISLLR